MEVRIGQCPLGSVCEDVKEGNDGNKYIERCPWYQYVTGQDPQDENIRYDEYRCAIAWLPKLSVNTARESNSTAAAVENLTSEINKYNQTAAVVILNQHKTLEQQQKLIEKTNVTKLVESDR